MKTTIHQKNIIAEKPAILNPNIRIIGTNNPTVVEKPQFTFDATTKYNIKAIRPAKNTLPAISETKIHLKSNISHPILIFGPHPLYNS